MLSRYKTLWGFSIDLTQSPKSGIIQKTVIQVRKIYLKISEVAFNNWDCFQKILKT
jgi:hypothetical protein